MNMSEWLDSMNDMNDKMLSTVRGVYIGVVTNNKDPEKLGRVKIKIPIIDEKNELDWVRIATLMSGNGYGTLFVPEVGTEVLVAFLMGDIRQPVIIGALWNKKQKPPSGQDAGNNIRQIVTRSGHEVTFDDSQGKGKITVKSTAGQTLEIDDQKSSILVKDKSGQNAIRITGGTSNDIEVKSGTNKITINNKGDISIESLKGIKLKSTQVSIEANANLNLKANAAIKIDTNGILELKGSMIKIN